MDNTFNSLFKCIITRYVHTVGNRIEASCVFNNVKMKFILEFKQPWNNVHITTFPRSRKGSCCLPAEQQITKTFFSFQKLNNFS